MPVSVAEPEVDSTSVVVTPLRADHTLGHPHIPVAAGPPRSPAVPRNRIGVALAAADDPTPSGVSFPEAVLPLTLMTHPMMALGGRRERDRRTACEPNVSILHG